MKSCIVLLIAVILPTGLLTARPAGDRIFVATVAEYPAEPGAGKGKAADPDYKAYQEGYRQVLNGEWQNAKKTFDLFLKKYPSSGYRDDATYWSAYALKHYNRKAAIGAYVRFLANYQTSRYFEDAVADLAELENRSGHTVIVTAAADSAGMPVMIPDADAGAVVPVPDAEVSTPVPPGQAVTAPRAHSYGFSYSVTVQKNKLAMLERTLDQMKLRRAPLLFRGYWQEEKPDRATQTKLQALHALTDAKDDTGTFAVLREVALNRSNAKPLRVEAMEELADRHSSDPLAVYLTIAKEDTDRQIQDIAFEQIGRCSDDKNRSVETLIEVFNAIPRDRTERRESVFYSIAEVGNDKAVDFLSRIARDDASDDLRSQAIYYLGSIGSPKAHTALYDLLREK
ncbi:MAG TPA: HEAT repeat domain-containing protein [Bacteroidota bacterium]|nr:HEAT repeat domain-containing protein [Bacteroidota bacterium]